MSYKKSVEQAITRFFEREQKKAAGPTRKNSKPEKKVEQEVLAWCKAKGWSVSVVESKAVFSQRQGRFLQGQAKKGFADLVGLTDTGRFVAIELKAPGKRSTLREEQRKYLHSVIAKHGFAAVVDCATLLDKTYTQWTQHTDPQIYLLSCLPPEPKRRGDGPLFD